MACNIQPNTTSSQVNQSNYPSPSCNIVCEAIKVSLNIKKNILEAVICRPLAFNSAGLPDDLMILISHYVKGICLIINLLSLSLSNFTNQS